MGKDNLNNESEQHPVLEELPLQPIDPKTGKLKDEPVKEAVRSTGNPSNTGVSVKNLTAITEKVIPQPVGPETGMKEVVKDKEKPLDATPKSAAVPVEKVASKNPNTVPQSGLNEASEKPTPAATENKIENSSPQPNISGQNSVVNTLKTIASAKKDKEDKEDNNSEKATKQDVNSAAVKDSISNIDIINPPKSLDDIKKQTLTIDDQQVDDEQVDEKEEAPEAGNRLLAYIKTTIKPEGNWNRSIIGLVVIIGIVIFFLVVRNLRQAREMKDAEIIATEKKRSELAKPTNTQPTARIVFSSGDKPEKEAMSAGYDPRYKEDKPPKKEGEPAEQGKDDIPNLKVTIPPKYDLDGGDDEIKEAAAIKREKNGSLNSKLNSFSVVIPDGEKYPNSRKEETSEVKTIKADLSSKIKGIAISLVLSASFSSDKQRYIKARVMKDVFDSSGQLVISERAILRLPIRSLSEVGRVNDEGSIPASVVLKENSKFDLQGSIEGVDGFPGIPAQVKRLTRPGVAKRVFRSMGRVFAGQVNSGLGNYGGNEIANEVNEDVNSSVNFGLGQVLVQIAAGTRFTFYVSN